MRKSKAERQRWWRNLSSEKRAAYIEKIVARKAGRRKAKEEAESDEVKKIIGRDKCCENCFHLKTKSCDGLSSLKKVCIQWFEIGKQK